MGEIKQNSSKPSSEKEVSREVHREAPRPMPKAKKKKVAKPIFFSVLIVALIAFGTFYFITYQQLNDKYASLTMSDEDRGRKIVSEVASLYTIPKYDEEKPTIYVVNDKDQLANNQFFKDAKANDTMLAYPKSDLAILYRPDDNKIIKVDTYTKVNAKTAQIAIIGPADKLESVEKLLKSSYSNVSIVSKDAPKSIVTQGVVVDVSGKEADATAKLAALLGLQVGTLPNGEVAPKNATMVVVLPSETAPAP